MEKSEKTREKIIEQTIALINENDGNTGKITIRKIAERSEVGIGLINHYFDSKDKLIENCVQRIINGVIYSFRPELCKSSNPSDIMKCVVKQVIDFLMENPQISRISILGDLANPKELDNTMCSVLGLAGSYTGGKPEKNDISDSFMVLAILQEAFLRKDVQKNRLGIDFYDKVQRDAFIDNIVDKIKRDGGC